MDTEFAARLRNKKIRFQTIQIFILRIIYNDNEDACEFDGAIITVNILRSRQKYTMLNLRSYDDKMFGRWWNA